VAVACSSLAVLADRLLVAAVAVEGLALLGVRLHEPMQALVGHRPLTQWLSVLAAPVLLFAAEEARKAVARRRRAGRRASTVGAVRG
jgi:hypothetical protein